MNKNIRKLVRRSFWRGFITFLVWVFGVAYFLEVGEDLYYFESESQVRFLFPLLTLWTAALYTVVVNLIDFVWDFPPKEIDGHLEALEMLRKRYEESGWPKENYLDRYGEMKAEIVNEGEGLYFSLLVDRRHLALANEISFWAFRTTGDCWKVLILSRQSMEREN